ncbi:MAG: AAA family ATPase [Methyloglobulus sp.]|nr:AAA family ATPase [Methyloglobulus sp.]
MVNPVNKPLKTVIKPQINVQISGQPLITKERTQRLDLLKHLVANLANGIVVCGPEGIGKTRLLNTFKDAKTESWLVCLLKGDNSLSLERIQELLSEMMGQAIPGINMPSLANAFDRLAKRDSKVVLIIDDAGNLVPGLIENIIIYAQNNPVLRVVFALTHSELYLKTSTDPAVDNCYHIDIPPLSEQQCGEFLEYLSTLPKPRIQFNSINESMTGELYRETHGIPGNILAHLPEDNSKKVDYSKPVLIAAVAGLVILALGVQWWSSRPKPAEQKTATVASKQNVGEGAQQVVAKSAGSILAANAPEAVNQLPTHLPPETAKVSADVADANQSAVVAAAAPVQVANAPALNPESAVVATPMPAAIGGSPAHPEAVTDASQEPTAVPVSPGLENQWLTDQPADNYTLQLMALSKERPIVEVLQRYQSLGQDLRFIKTKTKKGNDRFVLVYGSYASPEQASLDKQKLPKELKKTWLRKISSVQSELGGAIPADDATPEATFE